jgi:acyl carrier protein
MQQRSSDIDQVDAIKEQVKEYVLREFLPGEDPKSLTDSTALISGGILDSISTIKLITFLEQTFRIQIEAHEMSPDHLDDLTRIAAIVREKSAAE